MDFEIASDFPPENACTISPPRRRDASVETNVMGVPVTVGWWNGEFVHAEIPTNYGNLALKFISAADQQGNIGDFAGGSWDQHLFNEGGFMVQKNGVYSEMGPPATVTFAVVPNVRAAFYVQPRLLSSQ